MEGCRACAAACSSPVPSASGGHRARKYKLGKKHGMAGEKTLPSSYGLFNNVIESESRGLGECKACHLCMWLRDDAATCRAKPTVSAKTLVLGIQDAAKVTLSLYPSSGPHRHPDPNPASVFPPVGCRSNRELGSAPIRQRSNCVSRDASCPPESGPVPRHLSPLIWEYILAICQRLNWILSVSQPARTLATIASSWQVAPCWPFHLSSH